jgi:pimeloyl-ACP methyl ester carboxylesterase
MSPTIANTSKGPIEYRLEGRGPTVMVLNGGHCSRESRLSHERLTEHGFSVLIPSRPGYDSTPCEAGRSAQEAADALAALMAALHLPTVDVIGISAAGPTALAFAVRHPSRIRKLVLESAVTTIWPENRGVERGARLLFGGAEGLTWGLIRLVLRLAPMTMMRLMLQPMTTLDINVVMQRMSPEDLSSISAPVLAMYSPFDKSVPPRHAKRVATEVATCELYEVPADTHLIWIGKSAQDVWERRLSFLRS